MLEVWIGQGVWALEAELSVDEKLSPDDFSALQGWDSDGKRYGGAVSHGLPLLSPDSLLPSVGSSRLPLPEAEQTRITVLLDLSTSRIVSQSKHLFYTNCLAPGILTTTGCCLKVRI